MALKYIRTCSTGARTDSWNKIDGTETDSNTYGYLLCDTWALQKNDDRTVFLLNEAG